MDIRTQSRRNDRAGRRRRLRLEEYTVVLWIMWPVLLAMGIVLAALWLLLR